MKRSLKLTLPFILNLSRIRDIVAQEFGQAIATSDCFQGTEFSLHELNAETVNFFQADGLCESEDLQLVKVINAEQQQFLVDFLLEQDVRTVETFWLGNKLVKTLQVNLTSRLF